MTKEKESARNHLVVVGEFMHSGIREFSDYEAARREALDSWFAIVDLVNDLLEESKK